MAKRKPGDWWDKSWSVVSGCTPVGAGCANCWAAALAKRFPTAHLSRTAIDTLGPDEPCPHSDDVGFTDVLTHPDRLDIPLRARKPRVYAVSLLGDLFHEQVPAIAITDNVFEVMYDCVLANKGHQFVLLTKRWERAANYLCSNVHSGYLANVILMGSVWDQASTDAACAAFARLPPGVRRGLHMEPLIEPALPHIPRLPSWIVVGGETGPQARPMHPDWVRQIRDQCQAGGVPFWLKSWGRWIPLSQSRVNTDIPEKEQPYHPWHWPDGTVSLRLRGKVDTGRQIDGREWNEVPW